MHNSKLILVGLFAALPLSAAVVVDSNIVLGDALGFPGADHSLTIYQDQAATDSTAIFLTKSGTSLTWEGTVVDEGSDWYLVSLNDEFTLANIQANLFTPFTGTHNVGYGSFFLGVTTGIDFGSEGPNRTVFGWVELNNSPSTLSEITNAVTYSGTGIVIGSTTAIPEARHSILASALLALALVVRRQFRTRGDPHPSRRT